LSESASAVDGVRPSARNRWAVSSTTLLEVAYAVSV